MMCAHDELGLEYRVIKIKFTVTVEVMFNVEVGQLWDRRKTRFSFHTLYNSCCLILTTQISVIQLTLESQHAFKCCYEVTQREEAVQDPFKYLREWNQGT